MDPDIDVVGLAENGHIALKQCEDQQPDVVLMDIHMPVMDGVEATRQIKAAWPQIRVIILTTFQEISYVVDALGAGAEGYLLKAIHPKDLAAGIKWVHQGGTLIPQDIARMLVQQARGAADIHIAELLKSSTRMNMFGPMLMASASAKCKYCTASPMASITRNRRKAVLVRRHREELYFQHLLENGRPRPRASIQEGS